MTEKPAAAGRTLFDDGSADDAPRLLPQGRVSVLLPHRLGLLTYAGDGYAPGEVVAVPLGGRQLIGVVWDDPPDDGVDDTRLKAVTGRASSVVIGAELRRFADFAARYTMSPRGSVLRMILRNGEGLAEPRPDLVLQLSPAEPERWTPAREKVRQALAGGPLSRRALLAASGASAAVVASLVRTGVLTEVKVAPAPPPQPCADGGPGGPGGPAAALLDARPGEAVPPDARVAAGFSAGQMSAIAAVRQAMAGGFQPMLVEGVTGSGKTAVYLEAIAAALRAGRQALVLMPEIALTPMVTTRLTERFGAAPGEWHSERPAAARAALWRRAATGTERIIVGARSALFLPFADLGLIVVDEEHDASFKQEDGVIYHARDMAIARAQAGGIPVLLASATPSVETRINAARGRYRRIVLGERHGGASLPRIAAVDLRRTPPPRQSWLAPSVREAVTETLASGEQALLFLNRRGYAPLTVCRRCGHRVHCPNCAASLVDHRLRRRLVCHHCGHDEPRPNACPSCKGEDTLSPCGPGVERVEEEARALWPAARVLTLSSDLSGGPRAILDALRKVEAGEVDIVVGTQLVAKGFTFPKLQFVAVVDADLGLENGDPRAAERTFQLLTQVTGRAGRVRDGGRALIQTHAPDHPAIRAMVASDAEAFYAAEVRARREGELPPFQRLAAIVVSAPDNAAAHGHATALARTAPGGEVEVLGPAEAPLAVLRGRWRYRLLVRAPRTVPLQDIMGAWLAAVPVTGTVRRAVDIDPQSFL